MPTHSYVAKIRGDLVKGRDIEAGKVFLAEAGEVEVWKSSEDR